MVEFAITAAILGFVAVFVVPWISGIFGGFVPANFKQYLPGTSAPALTTVAIVNAVVFGAILALVLVLLGKAGVRAHTKGVEV